ncbi:MULTISPECIES: tetratricopeptide repeat protein [Burkholderia]|jgi:tetratricopeptide (TPR) repeat protein|nr:MULTISPECIES: tetratricopeptide repeat-containing glycosyltransferase family protein [Burkholderia]MDP9546297.1 tetratricopeptide (TPR) repeat protein [Burkholderia cepacia]MBR7967542.1 glycosyltransferase family protein [Burkholderia cenocepacia]MBR8389976.1 glycosyltransferase family protein [Burkholderia cenocepacia]MBR8431517.1 glycosyltransferase family protein [Burkholderia cenocepacia]MBR8469716.1 glycosyltransferase family protein [Burkholderia cenocepacia]
MSFDDEFSIVAAQAREAEAAGQFDKAADLLQVFCEKHPHDDRVLLSCVDVLLRAGRAGKALEVCDRAIAATPKSAIPWRTKALVCFNHLNDRAAAIASLKAGVAAFPSNAELHLMLADASFQMLDFDASREHGAKAAEFGDPGIVLRARHRFLDDHEGAVQIARAILEQYPADVGTLVQGGISLYLLGRPEESLSYLYRAAEHDPYRGDVLFPLANLLLLLGDTKAGWRRYEMLADIEPLRSGPPAMTTYHDRLWRGQPLQGKRLLVISHLGLGDCLMYARYARNLKAAGAHVTLCVKPELMQLLRDLEGVDELLGAWPVEIWGNYDYWIFENLLPARLGAVDGEVPVYRDGYIKLKDRDVANALADRRRASGRLRIGLCWDTSPNYFAGRARSLAPEDLRPLAEIENVDWFVLQKHPIEPDFAARSGLSVLNLSGEWNDLYDTAVFATSLDLTISICSAPVHLAGALGLPAWVMLGAPEWRWGAKGDVGPWYPNVRIFRQAAPGNWRSVTEAVRDALRSEREVLRRME